MGDHNPYDEELRRRLTAAAHSAAGRTHLPDPSALRRQARRRQVGVAVLTSAAVAAVVTAVVVVANPTDPTGAGPAATSSPTETGPPSPTLDPTTPEPSGPTTTPSQPTSSPAPSPTSPPPTDLPVRPVTEIPAGFQLPHEGEPSDDPDITDWITTEPLATPWELPLLCNQEPGELMPTDAARTDFRQVKRTGPELGDTYQLAVYPSAAEAVAVMGEVRDAVRACPGGENPFLPAGTVRTDMAETGMGGESLSVVSSVWTADGQPAIGGGRAAMTRVGNAIFLTATSGEDSPRLEDEPQARLTQRLADFVPQMCVFTVAGC